MNDGGQSAKVRRKNSGPGHSYRRREGDEWVPLDGVTSLLNGLPKPALVPWAAETTAIEAIERRDEIVSRLAGGADFVAMKRLVDDLKGAPGRSVSEAARKGQDVHVLAEALISGKEVEVPTALAAYVESAVDFLDAWKVRPLLTETVVYNLTENYAGTLDMVVTSDLLPGEVILADWKTGGKGIYNEAALQLAAYRNAEAYILDGVDLPFADLGVTRSWGVWIRDRGWDVYELETGPEEFEMFLSVAGVARIARSIDPWKGGRSLIGPTLDHPVLDLAAVLVEGVDS